MQLGSQVFAPLDERYIAETYRYVDSDGRKFTTTPLTGPGGSGKGNPVYEWNGHTRAWRYSRSTMEQLDREGQLYYSRTGYPRRKLYLDQSRGVPAQDIWADIRPLTGSNKERVGYPTQKPLALLDRIIRASSNPDDMVLDPFCGCATACVAADRLERQWVGIDLSPLAAKLVETRMHREGALLFKAVGRDDIPRRTDIESLPNYRTHKHTLYGKQEGNCTGCRTHFPFRNLTIDHVIPQAKGGTDHPDNLQLLCGACNSMKGTGTQEELIAKLVAEGIRAA